MNYYGDDLAFEQFMLYDIAIYVNSKQDKIKLRVKGNRIVYQSMDYPNVTYICGVDDIREMILKEEANEQ